jgi:serine/threonine-protein kinase SRPK3
MSSSESESESSSYISSSSDDCCEQSDNIDLKNKLLNKYNIISEIGRGADAIVWLAFNIEDSKYYAIKVNEPNEFKKGLAEINFLKKLSIKEIGINHIKDSFTEIINNKKYACGVFELQTGNLDCLLRKGNLEDGLPITNIKKIMKQLLLTMKYLHQKMKIYHADIKTDNILLKGINNYDKNIIEQYNSLNFFETYQKAKITFCTGKNITEDKIKSEDKRKIREVVHNYLCTQLVFPDKSEKYNINEEYINQSTITLSDYGAYCGEDEHYDTEFGTRYYRAPEIILGGETSYSVDIWAIGCVFYELLTGRLLFDPEKDSKHSRDENHLSNINELCGNFPIGFLKKTKYWKMKL